MKNDNNYHPVSLLTGMLGLIFVTLKLTGHITWSWWWVLLPFYGPFVVSMFLLCLALLLKYLALLLK